MDCRRRLVLCDFGLGNTHFHALSREEMGALPPIRKMSLLTCHEIFCNLSLCSDTTFFSKSISTKADAILST